MNRVMDLFFAALCGRIAVLVAQRIAKSTSIEQAESLYDDFMSRGHQHRKELVWAAYVFKACKLRSLTLDDAWREMAFRSLSRERLTCDNGFWQRVIFEAGYIQDQIYPGSFSDCMRKPFPTLKRTRKSWLQKVRALKFPASFRFWDRWQ